MAKDKNRQENISPFPPQVSTRGGAGEMVLPSLRDYARIMFRHKWKIVLTFLFVSSAGTFLTMMMPNEYQSNARLLIRSDRGSLGIDPSLEGLVTTTQRNSRPDLTSELEILRSEVLTRAVVEVIGVERLLNIPETETIESIYFEAEDPISVSRSIAVRIVQDMITMDTKGDIIRIAASSWNPALAHDVLASAIDTYHEHHIKAHSSAASPEMFKTKSDEILIQLNVKKAELSTFLEQFDVGSIEDQEAAAFQRVTILETAMSDVRVEISAADARLSELESVVEKFGGEDALDISEMQNPQVIALEARLMTLQLEETELKSKYADGSKTLRNVREQIKIVEKSIADIPATVPRAFGMSSDPLFAGPAELLEQARIACVELKASEKSLKVELAQAKGRLTNLEEHESEATMLQYEVDHLTQSYWEYMQSLERAEVAAALDRDRVGNVSVIQSATMPLSPVGPRRARNIALSLFAAMVLAIGLALVLDFLDDTLKSQEDVERRLGVNVLASVSADDFDKCI